MLPTIRSLYDSHEGYVSDKWSSYLDIYQELFAPFREKPVRFLEIGVQNGGSLQIWEKFFPHAVQFVGCDINPKVATLTHGPNTRVVVGDSSAPETIETIKRISPTFDIVLDDGSHRSPDIINAFRMLFPLIAPGGLFVAEDLHCSYWRSYKGGVLAPHSSIEYFKRIVDAINVDHWRSRRKAWALARLRNPFATGRLNDLPIADLKRDVCSVRFFDSICVIEKAAGDTRLGSRIVAGNTAMVDQKPVSLATQKRVPAAT